MDSTLAPPHSGASSGNSILNNNSNNLNGNDNINSNGAAMINANGGSLTPGATGLSLAPSVPANTMMSGMNYAETNYDFFDPQNWMLDGLVDFNYTFVPALEGS